MPVHVEGSHAEYLSEWRGGRGKYPASGEAGDRQPTTGVVISFIIIYKRGIDDYPSRFISCGIFRVR